MPLSAYLQFTSTIPSGTPYLFVNADAFNSYFQQAYITIAPSNLPEATSTEIGAVKQATFPGFFYENPVYTYTTLAGKDIPLKADFLLLHNLVMTLIANYTRLQQELLNAGIARFGS